MLAHAFFSRNFHALPMRAQVFYFPKHCSFKSKHSSLQVKQQLCSCWLTAPAFQWTALEIQWTALEFQWIALDFQINRHKRYPDNISGRSTVKKMYWEVSFSIVKTAFMEWLKWLVCRRIRSCFLTWEKYWLLSLVM